jgi:hypothetical protein
MFAGHLGLRPLLHRHRFKNQPVPLLRGPLLAKLLTQDVQIDGHGNLQEARVHQYITYVLYSIHPFCTARQPPAGKNFQDFPTWTQQELGVGKGFRGLSNLPPPKNSDRENLSRPRWRWQPVRPFPGQRRG